MNSFLHYQSRSFKNSPVAFSRYEQHFRSPAAILRKLAKKIIRGDWRAYLASAQDQSFEEIMLQGW